jgi:hypothetical protein
VARDKLDISQQELEDRLDVLLTLVPELEGRLRSAALKADLLASLLAQPVEELADRIITLKEILPRCNIDKVLGSQPSLLLASSAQLRADAAAAQELLGVESDMFSHCVDQQPLFLDAACVRAALDELRLLMPASSSPALMLLADPDWLLRLQSNRGGGKWLGEPPDSVLNEQV